MGKFIDRQELERRINKFVKLTNRDEQEWVKDECIRQAYAMPTADVVEVVRCKNCKYYERPSLEDDDYFCIAEHTQKLFSPNKNDFCSYGERKES